MDDGVAAKIERRHAVKPVQAASSRNGLFDDDDEDLFAPTATSKLPSAADKKGLSQSKTLFTTTPPYFVLLHSAVWMTEIYFICLFFSGKWCAECTYIHCVQKKLTS